MSARIHQSAPLEFLGETDACACAMNRCVLKSQLLNWLARAGSLALEAVRCVFRIDDWFRAVPKACRRFTVVEAFLKGVLSREPTQTMINLNTVVSITHISVETHFAHTQRYSAVLPLVDAAPSCMWRHRLGTLRENTQKHAAQTIYMV